MVGIECQKIIRRTLPLEKVASAAVLWKIIFSLGIAMRHPWRRTWLSLLGGGREGATEVRKRDWAPSASFNLKTCWCQQLLEGTETVFSPVQGSRHCLAGILLRGRKQSVLQQSSYIHCSVLGAAEMDGLCGLWWVQPIFEPSMSTALKTSCWSIFFMAV